MWEKKLIAGIFYNIGCLMVVIPLSFIIPVQIDYIWWIISIIILILLITNKTWTPIPDDLVRDSIQLSLFVVIVTFIWEALLWVYG